MTNLCPHTNRQCINSHLCEWCKVPPAYGWFKDTDSRGKVGWHQRWITPADHAAILGYYDQQILALQQEKAKVLLIPLKGETKDE